MTAPSILADPLHAFRFEVSFEDHPLGTASPSGSYKAGFSEITGLEATMEPVPIGEGGLNWGQHQRVGRTTFSTVVMRRGMTTKRLGWQWLTGVAAQGSYAHRMQVTIRMLGPHKRGDSAERDVITWTLLRAMPVKVKLSDLNAMGQDVGIEELHLVHEGIREAVTTEPVEQPQEGG